MRYVAAEPRRGDCSRRALARLSDDAAHPQRPPQHGRLAAVLRLRRIRHAKAATVRPTMVKVIQVWVWGLTGILRGVPLS